MPVMVGLSLSFCIRDIIEGRVQDEDVLRIEASTAYKTEDDWKKGIENYCELYWQKDPDRAEMLVKAMRDEGRIVQPRLEGGEAQSIHDGWWMK